MKIFGMDHFQAVCRTCLTNYYNAHRERQIGQDDTFIVWSVKALKNYKALASTTVSGDGVYAEYTYNGDTGELYEDIYVKEKNTCYSDQIKLINLVGDDF